MLSPQWLDELRARVTLSGVIQRTVKLQRAGHEWKACCPFHNEKSPSFTVNDSKGFYHCFGCGAHGDVIRWMTDHQGLAFMDAVKELAAQAGMEVPAPDPRAAQRAEQRATLIDVTEAAQGWFMRNLAAAEGTTARAYLATRGFSDAVVREFGFGFAPGERQALKGALGQFPEELLVEAGMRITVEGKEPYDRFRDRLMLPIHDARGRVIAFGGRILSKDTDAPKYLNSPDTPLFDKGRTLYNLHRAGPASRKTGRVIVVEGYMDVIALANAGIPDAVAPLGTALTEQQIELLWRLVEVPVLCFDGDAAGQRAAMRAITRALPMLRPAHSLGIVRLPAGLDPDDLIRQQGAAAMEAMLAQPASLLDTLWAFERDAQPLRTPEDKAGLKQRLMEHVEAIQHPDIRALYKRELNSLYSAFAFPARDWSGQPKVRDISTAKGWKKKYSEVSDDPKPSAELIQINVGLTDRERHLHNRLGAAIAAGLLVFPQYVIPWADTLSQIPYLDRRLSIFVEAAFDSDELTTEMLESRLAQANLQKPSGGEWDNLNFPFTWPPLGPENAEVGLENAMRLYAGLPQVKAALISATHRFAQTFSQEDYDEQQRLRRLANEMWEQMKSQRIPSRLA